MLLAVGKQRPVYYRELTPLVNKMMGLNCDLRTWIENGRLRTSGSVKPGMIFAVNVGDPRVMERLMGQPQMYV